MTNMKRLPARFYEQTNGNVPVREWLLSLSSEDRKLIGDDIRTAEFGWPVGMPLCHPIKGQRGLWEVRINLDGGRIARVFFCTHESNMILLHGFIKKTQETPGKRNLYRDKTYEGFDMTDNIETGKPGQLFEDFLAEQGTLEASTELAVKRVLAFQLAAAMKEQKISKVEMARRLDTSRSQLDRLLDPKNEAVTLATLARAAKAVGRTLRLELQ